MTNDASALYVCYFGVREPLVQNQVLPYLRELSRAGIRVSLLSFEPNLKQSWSSAAIAACEEDLRRQGIRWLRLGYHKQPALPATFYDIAAGTWRALRIARRERVTIFHGRSAVGATIATLAARLTGGRVIFDMRGFLAEEYVDAGHWKAGGSLARLVKRVEQWLCRTADGVVVLTERARETLVGASRSSAVVEVIPCCVDVARFAAADRDRTAMRDQLGIADRLVFVHAGSFGFSSLVSTLVQFLRAARAHDPNVYALVLTWSPADEVEAALARAGFSARDCRVVRAAPDEVPRYMAAADIGVALPRPGFARVAMSPTKVSEYLAAGLPIVVTSGVGDLDSFVERDSLGVLVRQTDEATIGAAVARICALRRDPQISVRCREQARARYDLNTIGGPRYLRLYRSVLRPRPRRVLALATYPLEAAASRYRIIQFIEPLGRRGVRMRFSPFLTGSLYRALYTPSALLRRSVQLILAVARRLAAVPAAARSDLVFVQREAMLVGPPVIEWVAARLFRRPLVLDLDDPTYLAADSPTYGRLAASVKWRRKTDTLIQWSRVVVCGNRNIAAYVTARHAQAEVLATIVDTRVFRPRATSRDVPVVGWIGTHSTFPFVERLFPIFVRLAERIQFRLLFVGSGRDEIAVPGVAVDARAWDLEREPEDFGALDIGLYPLPDTEWTSGKSGLKAVQYLSSGVPFVMSPVGICADIGEPDRTHFNATTDVEWEEALARLLTDRALRRTMGEHGRLYAEREYSIDRHADRLASILGAAS